MRKAIAAVVVTYNRCETLLKCIASLLQQQERCDILIVDNASTDRTKDMITNISDSRVFYRNTGANLGGAGGFNYGMRWAVESGYDYVWIMDDDCFPKEDALLELMKADKLLQGEYGFLSSVVLWRDGTQCLMNRQKIAKEYYKQVPLLKEGILRIEHATFVSLLFPAWVIRENGLPIKEFFIWGDDIEYTRRLSKRVSLPCYVVGSSQVIHAMKENTGSSIATDVPERIARYRYAFRNEAYLYRQDGICGSLYYLAKCGLNLCRILRYAKNNRIRRICVLVHGMWQGLFFFPPVEQLL